MGKNHLRTITPKFIMLHTLSHLLIPQLSFECDYSIASLSERIYCSDESDGEEMADIFIYTVSGDWEGTLGGLIVGTYENKKIGFWRDVLWRRREHAKGKCCSDFKIYDTILGKAINKKFLLIRIENTR